jgi:hypothetical protein
MNTSFDLNYRPDTYWPDELNQEQLLARIPGQVRRDIARQVMAEDGDAGLNAVAANEDFNEVDRRDWGMVHPSCMGGEYLPQLGDDDVEIARISLKSTTSDQVSIRAAKVDGKIHYSVFDEYETEYELAFTESELPLTLSELVELIDGSRHPESEMPGGLLTSHWEYMLDWNYALDKAIDFASIESAWYPELTEYYEQVAIDWSEAKRKARPDLYDEDYEEEDCA